MSAVLFMLNIASAQKSNRTHHTEYKYDAVNRLTNEVYDGVIVTDYTYDAVGNCLSRKRYISPKVIEKVQKLVSEHSEQLVNTRLLDLIKSGQVLFAANNALPEMGSSLEEKNGKTQVLLWYNFDFVMNVPDIENPADKDDYLRLAMYHEAVHIDNHFTGKYSLMPLISTNSKSEYQISQKIWDMEWSAVTKEWEFAKKIKKPYLVPVIYSATKNGENPKTFLEGFYQLQVTGNATALNKSLIDGFTERYIMEKRKLLHLSP